VNADEWKRYAAPAAFLLAVTVAVILVRAGLQTHTSTTHPQQLGVSTSTQAPTTTAPTVTTTRAKRVVKRFYTVAAGDSFGVISTKTGVPVATIERLNPTASSTSLHVGQRLRIK
jgi:LysM repeat protein